jgi:RNA 3'-terminal phosphate cyclase (ATP)
MNSPVEIDGSYGEGGGQILRTALTLSSLTGRPLQITEIRAGRSKPGLAPQHLTGLLALAKICDASVEGAKIASTEVVFEPSSRARPGDYTFDVSEVAHGKSAGSVTLILQALLLPLALASSASKLTLKGGTHVPWSPPFDFVSDVYLPVLSRMGITASCRLVAWGYYPAGGGRISAEIEPADGISPIELTERGALKNVQGRAVACNLKSHIAVRMINRSRNLLAGLDAPCSITPERVKGNGPGASLFLRAEYENLVVGFSSLGAPHKPSEKVAEEACAELFEHDETGAPATPHLADQLLLPAALASGRSTLRTSRITKHLLTNVHVIRQFLPVEIEVEGEQDGPGTVIVEGSKS